jgi:hypothetical protein
MLETKAARFVVDGPVTISARSGAFGAEFCVRHTARSVAELHRIGAIPRCIDVGALERAIDAVKKPGFAAPLVERRMQQELERERAAGAAHRVTPPDDVRLARLSREVELDGVADALDPRIASRLRRRTAARALEFVRDGSYAVTSFELERGIDVRAPLVFDADIGMCRALDVRVRDGAAIESRAAHFVLHARSFRGTWRSTGTTPTIESGDGQPGGAGGDGGPGRPADCQGIFSKDLPPTNGLPGQPGGNGGDASPGGDGSAGGSLEQHLEILLPGIDINTSGGGGGKGGRGGDGGKGGNGGDGGEGNNCEPSGGGGAGGNGGPGGRGGNGGKGGDAGEIYIYYVSDQTAGQPPVLKSEGGAGGLPGNGGAPGAFGEHGDWGGESKWGKKTWDPAPTGSDGIPGAPGLPGNPGSPGKSFTAEPVKVPFV